MRRKAFEAEVKAAGNTDAGEFTALVSVFNNIDHVGDRVLPGAFTKTLERWRASNDPVPVILSHNWDDPFASLGVANPKDIKQTPQGLQVKGTLDINDNDVARQVYKLMKRRSLKAFSFGYLVPDGGENLAEDGANELSEVDLVEIGPTLKGANPAAQLQAVKSALEETKEPRDEATLRKQADRVERDAQRDELPDAQQTPEGEKATRELLAEAVREEVESAVSAALGASLKLYEREPRDEATQRKQLDKVERKQIQVTLPSGRDALKGMAKEAEGFIAAESDPESAAVMRDVLDTLKALSAKDRGEGGNVLLLGELLGAKQGLLKSVWTTAVINDLPDSAFLFIEPGGSKDADGKTTPRSLRHFPYKDANGMVDLPHLQNALARIPQSNLPQDVKDRLTQKAQQILDTHKSAPIEDAIDEEPTSAKSAAQDPLRRRSEETVLDVFSDGVASLRKPPEKVKAAPPQPAEERDLRRQSRDLMLELLSE